MASRKTPIKYTSREFDSIKRDLIEHARRYYPETFRDFNEASFGSLVLDSVAYIGDILSYYLDYQANETFLDTAIEYDNVLRLGEQVGYKQPLKSNSFGIVTLYILTPIDAAGIGPDSNYLPKLARGSRFSSKSGEIYTLIDDIDFANENNEIVVARADSDTGTPTFYAIKTTGQIISGELKDELIDLLTDKGNMAATINRKLSILKAILNKAKKDRKEFDQSSY